MNTRYDYQKYDPQIRALWEKEKIYSFRADLKKKIYSIDTPPPTVSGSLHIGHIFSYTQTDIIARYKRMSGYNVFYPFGFDDNGLPTERYVEKIKKVRAPDLGREKFISLCLEESKKAETLFKNLWQQMGISADWSKTYETIAPRIRALSQTSFLRLLKKDAVYRKKEPAPFCTTCKTSVAQAELDDSASNAFFNDIIFHTQENKEVIIGTTRPELLPSSVALLYHPKDKRHQSLEGKTAIVPIFQHTIPCIADEQVDPEKGTGLVMCCTFGDKQDIVWYKRHGLAYRQSINENGTWTKDTGPLALLKVYDARKKILELLAQNGSLCKQEEITNTVQTHERCKREIEYITRTQWFLKILPHKDLLLQQADKISWHPSFMKARLKDWIKNLQWDWCLSRQRFYGIPFPVWHCISCGAIIPASIDMLPIDPLQAPPPSACPVCGKNDIKPDTDVMDTWNTSSLSPYICAQLFFDTPHIFDDTKVQNFLPMSMRPQAHDIIRTWSFYTMVKTLLHNNTIPWNDAVISGHVLNPKKEKISKSKENTPTNPDALLKQYPADVIRFWTASGHLGQNVSFSENQFKIGNRLVTKLWNAFRFIKEHIPQTDNQSSDKPDLINAWIMHQINACFQRYDLALKKYEFGPALNEIQTFFWHDFCDNYLEIIKNQLFNPDEYEKNIVYKTKHTLLHVGMRILQLFAPYFPHVTEQLYQECYRTTYGTISLHSTTFKTIQTFHQFEQEVKDMEHLLFVINSIRKLKTEHHVSLKTQLAHMTLYSNNQLILDILKQHEQLIKGVTHAQAYTYTKAIQKSGLIKEKDRWFARVNIDEQMP